MTPPEFDVTRPNAARMYDYALGGKDNYAADRAAVEEILRIDPEAVKAARQNRAFLRRAVRYVADEGVTQFIDIGSGLPTAGNTHEVVQSVHRSGHVVYVDNDKIVLAHARARLDSTPEGQVSCAQADLRDPVELLQDEELRSAIDFRKPVGLVLVAILHFVDDPEAHQAVAKLTAAMPHGSWLIISHGTPDGAASDKAEAVQSVYKESQTPLTLRSLESIHQFFGGYQLEKPGIVNIVHWPRKTKSATPLKLYGGVGRKP